MIGAIVESAATDANRFAPNAAKARDPAANANSPTIGGKPMSREEADARVRGTTGEPLKDEDLAAVGNRAILVRLLHNLINIARRDEDAPGVLRYLDAILTVKPDSAQDRWVRAVIRFQVGNRPGAGEDANWLLENRPVGRLVRAPGRDLRRFASLRRSCHCGAVPSS